MISGLVGRNPGLSAPLSKFGDIKVESQFGGLMTKVVALFITATLTVALAGCSNGSEKQFDISPIFPLSSGKCAKYNGKQSGEGFNSTCMVSQSDCARAAEDWRQAMQK